VHPLVKLVIQSVEHFIETGKPLPCPDPLLDNLKQNAGTFVSIRNQDSLRGCIGTMTRNIKNLQKKLLETPSASPTKTGILIPSRSENYRF
jgi:hypothetical protein